MLALKIFVGITAAGTASLSGAYAIKKFIIDKRKTTSTTEGPDAKNTGSEGDSTAVTTVNSIASTTISAPTVT